MGKMKDIKSIIIGFLLATCMFLFMGQTSTNRYTNNDGVCLIQGKVHTDVTEYDCTTTYAGVGGEWIAKELGAMEKEERNKILQEKRIVQEEKDKAYLLELEKLKPLEEILTNALKSNSYSGNSYSGGSGKYQISTSAWDNEVFITIFNTETGKLISNSRVSMKSGYESIQDMNRMIEDAFRK